MITSKPISRWARVDWETVAGVEQVGVVAFHKDGIKVVRYTINHNGNVTLKEVTQSRFNAKTKVEEYSFDFNFSDLGQGGSIEVSAEVEANDGSITELVEPRSAANLTTGLHSIHLQNRWQSTMIWQVAIAPKGSDSNDGHMLPFATFAKALSVANYGDTIQFGSGEFQVSLPSSTPHPSAGIGNWIIIKGAGQDKTTLFSQGTFRTTGKIKIEDVTIDVGRSGYANNSSNLWFHNCKFYSPSSEAWFADGVARHGHPDETVVGPVTAKGNTNNFLRDGYSVTDSWVDLYGPAFGNDSIVRNCKASRIWGDAFSQGNGIFNVDITNFAGYLTVEHSDVYQMFESKENVIVYGLNATGLESVQGIFCRPLPNPGPQVPPDPTNPNEPRFFANSAFINTTLIHVPFTSATSTNSGGPPFCQMGGKNIHVLFTNCKIPYQKILFNGDAAGVTNVPYPGWETRIKEDVILTNCDFHWTTMEAMHSTAANAVWHPIEGGYEYDGVRAYGCYNSVPKS